MSQCADGKPGDKEIKIPRVNSGFPLLAYLSGHMRNPCKVMNTPKKYQ